MPRVHVQVNPRDCEPAAQRSACGFGRISHRAAIHRGSDAPHDCDAEDTTELAAAAPARSGGALPMIEKMTASPIAGEQQAAAHHERWLNATHDRRNDSVPAMNPPDHGSVHRPA
jgi:hypothetical protein